MRGNRVWQAFYNGLTGIADPYSSAQLARLQLRQPLSQVSFVAKFVGNDMYRGAAGTDGQYFIYLICFIH
jgi:hypothetical protein